MDKLLVSISTPDKAENTDNQNLQQEGVGDVAPDLPREPLQNGNRNDPDTNEAVADPVEEAIMEEAGEKEEDGDNKIAATAAPAPAPAAEEEAKDDEKVATENGHEDKDKIEEDKEQETQEEAKDEPKEDNNDDKEKEEEEETTEEAAAAVDEDVDEAAAAEAEEDNEESPSDTDSTRDNASKPNKEIARKSIIAKSMRASAKAAAEEPVTPVHKPIIRATPRKTPSSAFLSPTAAKAAKAAASKSAKAKKRASPTAQAAAPKARAAPTAAASKRKAEATSAAFSAAKQPRTKKYRTLEDAQNSRKVIVDTPVENLDDKKTGTKRHWPKGWQRRVVTRKYGVGTDSYFYTPQEKFEFRSLARVKVFLDALPKFGGDEKKTLDEIGGQK